MLQLPHKEKKGVFENTIQTQDDIPTLQVYRGTDFLKKTGEEQNNYVFKIENIKNKLQSLVDQSDKLNLLEKNLRVILIGQPNAEKVVYSTKFLVRPCFSMQIKGITRESRNEFKIYNWITLVDTAGVHDSSDDLENEGIKRDFEQIEGADIIIWVVDVSVPYPIMN